MSWLTQLRSWLAKFFAPRTLGQRGEAAAARFLRRLGYRIVARGDRGRIGELDLVAVDGRTVVFVEVKTRTSARHGHPADAVDEEKQRRLARAALAYLKSHQLLECSTRFDVIAITWSDTKSRPVIEHFRNAFESPLNDGMF